ncbi:MAG: sulfatase-like hydrolase/transferase [Deltaproteobacteria bacterium]|nr:sulfatase-like hydrolase/transferase [Deltaproteobacteria bacterium]
MKASNMNVILITLDDVRADHLSCCGYHLPTTPVLDKLAKSGLLFRQAISNGPNTWSSFPSIMTSTYPLLYGGYARLEPPRKTIAEVLQLHGFLTAAFLSNSYLLDTPGYECGFKVFEDAFTSVRRGESKNVSRFSQIRRKALGVQRAVSRKFFPKFTDFKCSAECTNRRALMFIRKELTSRNPFFLWLHYLDVHYPLIPPKEYLESFLDNEFSLPEILSFNRRVSEHGVDSDRDLKKLCALYDASLYYLDTQLGLFIEQLDKLGILQNTLFVITSDHGEKLGERDGRIGHPPQVYEELIRVPLIISGPSIKPREVKHLVSNLDIAPTIIDYLDLSNEPAFEGRTLFTSGHTGDAGDLDGYYIGSAHKNAFVYELTKRCVGYRTERWKYICDDFTGQLELYDLSSDPKETTNLVDSGLSVKKELQDKISQHCAKIDLVSSYEANFDNKVMNRLRELGYL